MHTTCYDGYNTFAALTHTKINEATTCFVHIFVDDNSGANNRDDYSQYSHRPAFQTIVSISGCQQESSGKAVHLTQQHKQSSFRDCDYCITHYHLRFSPATPIYSHPTIQRWSESLVPESLNFNCDSDQTECL